MIPRLVLFAALSTSAFAADSLRSGEYDGLLLAVDKGRVTGNFSTGIGSGPTCAFYFAGTLGSGVTPITAYWPGQPEAEWKGELRARGDSSIEIRFPDEQPGGCAMAHDFAQEEMQQFPLDTPHPDWLAIRIVKGEKVRLSRRPEKGSEEKAYVINGDAVAVTAKSGNWDKVTYSNGATGKVSVGWLPESSLHAVP